MAEHPLVARYAEAESAEAALSALDAVRDEPVARAALEPLAEHYQDVAMELADDGRYAIAASAMQRAVDLEPESSELVGYLGWYELVGGDDGAAARAFERARGLPGGDTGAVDFMEAMALDEADRLEEALAVYDRAADLIAAATPEDLGGVLRERRDARERAGLSPDERDELAGELSDEPVDLPSALPWFPRDQHAAAIARWPEVEEALTAATYFARVDDELAAVAAHAGRRPALVAIDLERYVGWAAEHELEAADREVLEAYAEVEHAKGRSTAWPPGRNDPCWCGSGAKYKRCCGR